MRKYLPVITLSLSLAGLSFLIGFFQVYHLPKIEKWLLAEIEQESREKLPLRIWPQSAKITLFPPSLKLNDVRLLPQHELAKTMAPTVIQEAEVRLNWWFLITGRLRLGYVGVRGADIKLIVKDSPQKAPGELPKIDLSQLTSLPLDLIEVSQIQLMARLDPIDAAIYAPNLMASLENRGGSLRVTLSAPESSLKLKAALTSIPMTIDTKILVDEQSIKLTAFKAKAGESYIVAAGLVGERSDLKARLFLNLPEIRRWEQIFREPKIPVMQGQLKTEVGLTGAFSAPIVEWRIDANDLKIGNYSIGSSTGRGRFQPNILSIDDLSISNPAGDARIEKAEVDTNQLIIKKAHVKSKNLEIGELLNQFGLKQIPVRLFVDGDLQCSGAILKTDLTCNGEVQAQRLWVHAGGKKPKTIIAIDSARARGSVNIGLNQVSYSADIQVGKNSKGRSNGTVHFEKGFNIEFNGDSVDLGDVQDLAGLKLEGVFKISGQTEGTSSVGRVTLQARGQKVWLENFGLGDVEAEVAYRSGTLQFRKILGQIGTSRYQGLVSINLPKEEILIQARSPYLDIADLDPVFARLFKMPVSIAGTGAADIQASGPLNHRLLSYQFRSGIYRGSIAEESFDQLIFNVDSKAGHAEIQRGIVARGQSTIELKGRMNPEGKVDAVMVGRKLRLEESENLSKLGLDTTGQIDFSMGIRGQLPKPEYEAFGRLSKMIIADRSAAESTFKVKFNHRRIEGGGSFIGDVVNLDFSYPLVPDQPFYLKARANRWNFANAFSTFSETTRQRDIQTSLSGEVNLTSPAGGPQNASGQINISELRLRRGAVDVGNSTPISFAFKQGTVSSRPFSLEGGGGFLRGQLSEWSKDKVQASVTGKVDLSLLTLFTPFLADLQGRSSINIGFSGTPQKVNVAGSAYVEQGVVRFKEFPHAFTQIRADVLFSEQGVAINSLRSDLGGGTLTGEGRVRWQNRQMIPVDIKGQFQGVSLNVPEGFRTKGNGQWSMKGNYFPYIIAVNYDIDGGEITAEFQGADLAKKSVSPSTLLPKFLTQASDQPVHLDLSVNIKSTLPIRNSLIESPIRGKVRVVGPPNQPKLTGVLTPLPGGKVYFRDVPFEIQTGFVEYQDDPPDNAKIYLTAQTEVNEVIRDENNPTREKENEYQVNLLVQGRLKPQPKITLTSLPALAEKDIVSLLALGMTPGALEQNRTGGQIAASNSVQYGAAILQKPISKEVRNRLGLDLQISQSTSPTDNATTTTKLTFTKQFNPKLSASASRTIEKNPTTSAKLEYKVNRNVSVVGSWDGKEGTTQLEENKDVTPSIFGLDLEFKVNFK